MDAAVKSAPPAWQQALFEELFAQSESARFGLALADFCATLREICGKQLAGSASRSDTEAFLRGLRLKELALTRACAAGHEAAWTEFLTRYRSLLYQAALSITRDDSRGRELADSIYAELYGMKLREGADGQQRVSKLLFYTGRGSIEGWLRTVLAQEYVNRYRRERRLVSLEEETEAGTQFAASDPEPESAADPRLTAATDKALAELATEERFILAAYFLDGRTLAEIGRMLRVHESTISRKLERLTQELRKRILRSLVQAGMSTRAAEEALDIDVRDLAINVRQRLRPPPEEERV
jgi:RNA polymerase sigma-70 factor (ECF subfamily)